MNRPNKNSLALAGEFAVLSELALRGYDANMTLGHTKGVDILVSDPKKNKMFKLEVKTTYRDGKKEWTTSKIFEKFLDQWMMSKKHESIRDPRLFYCFALYLKRKSAFQFYIVPSKIVADYVKAEHQLFLNVKRQERTKVKDTDMRLFRIGIQGEQYPILTPLNETYEIRRALGDASHEN